MNRASWLLGAALVGACGCALSPDWRALQGGTGPAYDQMIQQMDPPPTAYFPMTDGPGSNGVTDLVKGSPPGLIMGSGVSLTGSAAVFDGSGGYIDLGKTYKYLQGSADAPMGFSSFTLEAWILAESSDVAAGPGGAGADVFLEGSDAVGYNVQISDTQTSADQGGPAVAIGASGSTNGDAGTQSCGVGVLITPGQGFYFVGEYDRDADVFTVSVNDQEMDAGCPGIGSAAGAQPDAESLYLGGDPSGQSNFAGKISRVAIYADYNMDPSTIAEHYAVGMGGP